MFLLLYLQNSLCKGLDMGFVREERYIVVKLKHLDDADEYNLRRYLEENNIETTSCVVVENNWPEYEKVWSMIEERVKGEEQ